MLDRLRDLGAGLSRFTERWVPDSWVICMILTAIAFALALGGAGVEIESAVLAWGDGVWVLLELAMQFTIAMVAAHACVSSRPVFRLLDRLARLPDPERPTQAVALAAVFSLVTGYLNWALCLVACALFVPFLARNNPKTDIRVMIAGAYLGLGTVWHCGLSGSAPLILATPGNPLIAPGTGAAVVDRLYPVTETLFNPFNLVYLLAIGATGLLAAVLLHPRRDPVCLSADQVAAILPTPPEESPAPTTPAERLEAFRGWVWLAVILLAYPLGHSILNRGFGTSWTINAYNVVFLVAALLLHGRPVSFLRACRQGVDAAWGIIVQFPFYAGIFGLMQNTGLGAWIGELFASFASQDTYPFVVYAYSAIMNLFVPSAGSKWLIEAPYLIPAANALDVSVVTVLLSYSYGDSTTNLIQPFFAIPILAVTRLRFGDVVGYTFLIAVACFAVSALAMAWIPHGFEPKARRCCLTLAVGLGYSLAGPRRGWGGMQILIVGGGLVGSTLAEKLSRDGHDVSVVDREVSRVRELADSHDVRVVLGNGATAPVLRRAGIEEADMVVATTNVDEVNMVVGLLASALFDVARIVVRLRDSDHGDAFNLINQANPIDHVCVNPVEAAVDRIAALLDVPGAVDVVSFLDDTLVVAGFRIHASSDFVGVRVSVMNLMFADTPTLAVAIERGDDWLIPHGEEEIAIGDLVYFAIAREHMEDVLHLVGVPKDKRRTVMIAGATRIGLELAHRLETRDLRVSLVEEDEDLARSAADELSETTVIRGSVTSQGLLEEEEIERVSTFVAVTPDHETNLVAGLLAKRLGAGRAVVLVDNPELVDLVGQLDIDAIISPRVLVIGLTLQHILGGRVRSVAQLLEDKIEILEAEVDKRSALTQGTLSEVKLPRGVLVAALRRGEQLLVPRGSDRAEPGDRVLLITTAENEPKLARFLRE